MLRRTNGPLLAISLLALILAVFGLTVDRHPGHTEERARLTPEQVRPLETLERAFTAIAEVVEPTVVKIQARPESTRFRGNDQETPGGPDGEENPFGDMFRRFPFPMPGQPRALPMPRRGGGTGSGVIVRIDGKDVYVLTNAHVVEDAGGVTVLFHGGTQVSGKGKVSVKGASRTDDLAVLKVTTDKPLDPAIYQARLGDSDALRVGQWAVAVGSPFGLESTFTVGVISALGRATTIQNTNYPRLIQTDAAINPGNSGGALVNVRGEVIGVNTAIATGGAPANAGVGFAIPINKARRVMEQLIATGKVDHGFVGVTVGTGMSPEQMREYTGVSEGAFVQQVQPGTPAEKAGIRDEDVIVEFDGKPVRTKDQLVDLASGTPPGTRVQVKVIRDRKPVTLPLTLAQRPDDQQAAASAPGTGENRPARRLGIDAQDLTADAAREARLPADLRGVLVRRVAAGSPADEAGAQAGDVITRANGRAIRSAAELQDALGGLKGGDTVFLRVLRAGPDGTRSGLTLAITPVEE
ncbi:MAG: PDZ domain-containing protein [Armatimonadetes bacterium]|nr:PDZ domain-containing protein [Armatimonadota bacterium]